MKIPAAFFASLLFVAIGFAAEPAPVPSPDAELTAAIAAVEATPEALAAHDTLLRVHQAAVRKNFKEGEALAAPIEARYRVWLARNPDSLGVNYGLGSLLYGHEDPRAKPFLLKVVALDPKQAKVFQMLAIDAERWGDEPGASEFMRRASAADPASPDYAFYYASGLGRVDPPRWESASLEVARRFPTHERGAQALYWLGARADSEAKRLKYWEKLRADFPPEKFSWSSSAMTGLFEAYLRTAPARATALARDMERAGVREPKQWTDRVAFAENFIAARALLAAGKATEAVVLLEKLPVERRSANARMITLLRAEIAAASGDVPAAYAALAKRQAATPEDETGAALSGYGVKLGKTPAQTAAEIWALRDAAAKPAPPFDLGLYTSDAKLSLASLRGKVVFVTFWFPGCGPCRAEFPHFEDVMGRFRGRDVVYLGINGIPKQDDYVLPFMAGTRYTFTPLRGTEAVTGPEGYAVRGYPANFLIDRDGRVIYRDFRAHDEESKLGLQRMIESLLDRPAAAGS